MAMTLVEQLTRDEGLRRLPYQDTLGVWTWGVGHNLDNPLSHLVVALLAQGDVPGAIAECLGEDVATVRGGLTTAIPWYTGLSDARRGVFENMAFALGVEGFLRFRHLLAACQAGQWTKAGEELLDSTWARQVGDRAQRLAQQLVTDGWT